jgi:hypothetical protein
MMVDGDVIVIQPNSTRRLEIHNPNVVLHVGYFASEPVYIPPYATHMTMNQYNATFR